MNRRAAGPPAPAPPHFKGDNEISRSFYIQTWLLGTKPPVTEDLFEQDQATPSFSVNALCRNFLHLYRTVDTLCTAQYLKQDTKCETKNMYERIGQCDKQKLH